MFIAYNAKLSIYDIYLHVFPANYTCNILCYIVAKMLNR